MVLSRDPDVERVYMFGAGFFLLSTAKKHVLEATTKAGPL